MSASEEGPSRRVGISVLAWVRALSDPGIGAAAGLVAVAASGFVLFSLGWRGLARTPYVPLQMPWAVSAGFTGIALIGAGLGALSIHIGRREDAALRQLTDEVVREAAELAERLTLGECTPGTVRADGQLREPAVAPQAPKRPRAGTARTPAKATTARKRATGRKAGGKATPAKATTARKRATAGKATADKPMQANQWQAKPRQAKPRQAKPRRAR